MKIDMTIFTHEDRDGITLPFSVGGKTYSTNGRLFVVQNNNKDFAENKPYEGLLKLIKDCEDHKISNPIALPQNLKQPTYRKEVCVAGCFDGYGCECANCGCQCPECNGNGFHEVVEGKAIFDNYNLKLEELHLLKKLPNLSLDESTIDSWAGVGRVKFEFDGGWGVVMSCRSDEPTDKDMDLRILKQPTELETS